MKGKENKKEKATGGKAKVQTEYQRDKSSKQDNNQNVK